LPHNRGWSVHNTFGPSVPGQVLLVHKGVTVVMRILILLAVPDVLHQPGGCVAQVEGNGKGSRFRRCPGGLFCRPHTGRCFWGRSPDRRPPAASASSPSGEPSTWYASLQFNAICRALGSALPMSSEANLMRRRAIYRGSSPASSILLNQ
jgi:hypothetical protein